MKIEMGPTGASIVGDILDVNKKQLERAIQDYDSQLYFKWNPQKQNGWGVWELRRRPALKSIKETIRYGGAVYQVIEYKEHDLEHHVWDLPVLNYSLLQRLKEADQFVMCNYEAGKAHRLSKHIVDMEDKAFQNKYEAKEKARADMLYNLKQDKKIIDDFRERVVSGVDPNHLMRFWGK